MRHDNGKWSQAKARTQLTIEPRDRGGYTIMALEQEALQTTQVGRFTMQQSTRLMRQTTKVPEQNKRQICRVLGDHLQADLAIPGHAAQCDAGNAPPCMRLIRHHCMFSLLITPKVAYLVIQPFYLLTITHLGN